MVAWWWIVVAVIAAGITGIIAGVRVALFRFSKELKNEKSPSRLMLDDLLKQNEKVIVETFAQCAEATDEHTGCKNLCGHLIAKGFRETLKNEE